MRVLNIVGARPNFVKIAPLIAEMRKHDDVQALLVHTGQHYDCAMSGNFLRDLAIPAPDFRITNSGADRRTRMDTLRANLAQVMNRARPDVVLVVGDVDSTVAGALAARALRIPVAHVEA